MVSQARFCHFGPYRLDLISKALYQDDKELNITRRSFSALVFFVQHAGELVEREMLKEFIWRTDSQNINDNSLKFVIARLRELLRQSDEGKEYIEIVRGRGYRFLGNVTYSTDESPRHKYAQLDSNRVRQLRIQRGWTQNQLADAGNITARTVSRVEQGFAVRSDTLKSLAKLFGVAAKDLLAPKSERKPISKLSNVDVIRAFIASPGDLGEERVAFRTVIEEVNKIKASSLGCVIDALGWEDTLPGKGRPQELINQDVRSCQLFVLLLWKRWGTASGKYSSGTEEEFEIAQALNEKTDGVPEIWLYFKTVPEYMLADPGQHLQKVLNFRTKIETERSFLYRTFDESQQWERMFREHLCRWLDEKRPFDPPPTYIKLPIEVTKNMQQAMHNAAASSQTAQAKLEAAALKLCSKGIEAAARGRLTEAETLFASSIETLPLPETLNVYTVFLETLGKKRRADEHAYQLRDLYVLRGRVEADRSAQISSEMQFSCFISYSGKDNTFVERLYSDLQSHGIRSWYAPQDLRIGDDFVQRIDQAIHAAQKVILVLSGNSVDSAWMETEVEAALQRETVDSRVRLFPIRLDDSVMASATPWAAMLRRTRHIGDFCNWKDHDSYARSFERLLRDLQ